MAWGVGDSHFSLKCLSLSLQATFFLGSPMPGAGIAVSCRKLTAVEAEKPRCLVQTNPHGNIPPPYFANLVWSYVLKVTLWACKMTCQQAKKKRNSPMAGAGIPLSCRKLTAVETKTAHKSSFHFSGADSGHSVNQTLGIEQWTGLEFKRDKYVHSN